MTKKMKTKEITVEQVKKLASPDELELYSYVIEKAEEVASEIAESFRGSAADKGEIIAVEGPLSSGKTVVATMLASKLENDYTVGCYQPYAKGRTDIKADELYSRSGVTYPSKLFKTKRDIQEFFHTDDFVIIDELHLISGELQSYFVSEMKKFRERGGWVVLFSILYNSQGDPFVLVELCRMLADRKYKLLATCQKCGSLNGVIGQRLINGKATSIHDPEYISPSDSVVYEPRCLDCFVYSK